VSISTAATSGSRLDLLVATRDLVAAQLDEGVAPRDLASLSRRLMELAKEIEGLKGAKKNDPVRSAAATPDAPLRVAS
jgi:hypothetical protein